MLRPSRFFALMIIAAAFAAPTQVKAEEPAATDLLLQKITPAFQCTAQTEGQLTYQANKQCKCGYKPAEAATGLPGRWAWDCGIMRPRCEVTPADTGSDSYALPPVIIERPGNEKGDVADDKDEGGN